MINNLPTSDYRLQNALELVENIGVDNNYYFFFGDFLNHANVQLQPVYDNTSNTVVQVYSEMIAGKLITANSVYPVINNVSWVSNTIYAMYDDIDPNLPQEAFYIITNEGSFYHVWKCLDNNANSASTVMPSVVFQTLPYFQTSDGYRWKYMTSVPVNVVQPWLTANTWFPLIANASVANSAVVGDIEIFKVLNSGANYNNYTSATFVGSDIAINGDPTLFNLSNSTISTVNGFYTGCLLYLTGGVGQGQTANIVNYVSNTTGNIIKIATPFLTLPQNGTQYNINPTLKITADGNQTVNCVARCLVNALATNSIYRVESLTPGAGYWNILSANVVANNVVGVSNTALVRAIASPEGGHGSNLFSELYCHSVGISTRLVGSEGNTIPTQNQYQQIGVIQGPLFANIVVNFSPVSGVYQLNEPVYSVTVTQINSNSTITLGSSNVSCNTAQFGNQLLPNSYIIISSIDGTLNQLTTVNVITSANTLTINQPGLFSCSQAIMYSPTFVGNSVCTVPGSNPITIDNVSGLFSTGSRLIGFNSGAVGTITTTTRNGVSKPFNTFISLNKYNATLVSGSFITGEQLVQGANTAFLHSYTNVAGTLTMYVGLSSGGLLAQGTVIGANSGASANITLGYGPEIHFGSGEIIYIENISPVTRSNNQTETFNLVLNF